MEVDLTKPAFGPGSQKINEEPAKETPVLESLPKEEKVEEPVAEPVKSDDETEEEQKVPYSRFKKFHDRALEAEREAQEWRAKAESITSRPEAKEAQGDIPSYWVELYGDSEQSKRAWGIQQEANNRLIQEAQQKAVEAVKSERFQEEERVSKNEEAIDAEIDALATYAGRPLTQHEQSQILDIVDEFTPKDDKGNYLGATIPFEKAWDIYELKSQASKAPKAEARNKVAALTGSPTSGEPSSDEKDKNFNPLDWSAYKKRI